MRSQRSSTASSERIGRRQRGGAPGGHNASHHPDSGRYGEPNRSGLPRKPGTKPQMRGGDDRSDKSEQHAAEPAGGDGHERLGSELPADVFRKRADRATKTDL